MPTYNQYAVTIKSNLNIREVEQYLEKDTSTEQNSFIRNFIPDRVVTASIRNQASTRTTYYQLTDTEATNLREFPTVLGVELTITESGDPFDGVIDTSSIIESFIPIHDPRDVNNQNLTSSVANPALIAHSFPSSSNVVEFIHNTVNNVVSDRTPGTGNDNFFTYKSSKTGKHVDIIYNDGFCLQNHADFFAKDGSSRFNGDFSQFILNDFIPNNLVGTSNGNPIYNYSYLYWVRRQFMYPAETSLHGTNCLSTAFGSSNSNAINANPQLSWGTPSGNLGGAFYDMVRHYHVSKSINPYIGEKNPTIWGKSSGYQTPGINKIFSHTDVGLEGGESLRLAGGIVSGSFDFSEITEQDVNHGIRINYENIDYYFISSSTTGTGFSDHTIGSSPIRHKRININSSNGSIWVSKINLLDFLNANFSDNQIHITSSERISWHLTAYKGRFQSFGTGDSLEGSGGVKILNLTGSSFNERPRFAIVEWAPLGTPIGLSDPGLSDDLKAKYSAPRADYFLPSPNADNHGIDNGFNLPFGDSFFAEDAGFRVMRVLGAAAQAAQEEASKAGVILTTSRGNESGVVPMFSSTSIEDEFHRPEHDMELTTTNPLTGETITGHPYNSYFIVSSSNPLIPSSFAGVFQGGKVYYQRQREHHSVISTGNIIAADSSSDEEYFNRIISNIGGDTATHMYGNYTRVATTKFKNDGAIQFTAEFIPTGSGYNSSDDFYDMDTLLSTSYEFTQSYNNLFNEVGGVNETLIAYEGGVPVSNVSTNQLIRPITSSGAADLDDPLNLYFTWPGSSANINYRPNGPDGIDNPTTFLKERATEGFGGTSGANPLLVGFLAGFLEENPTASVNDVRDFIDSNSIATLPLTGSNPAAAAMTHFDGFYCKNTTTGDNIKFFVSGNLNTRNIGIVNYAPFTPNKVFVFPFTDIETQLLKIKNLTLKNLALRKS